jgi:hypothetical protein
MKCMQRCTATMATNKITLRKQYIDAINYGSNELTVFLCYELNFITGACTHD